MWLEALEYIDINAHFFNSLYNFENEYGKKVRYKNSCFGHCLKNKIQWNV